MTIQMTELEIDDVAFLTSTDSNGHNSKPSSSYGRMCRSKSQTTRNVLNWRKTNFLTLGLCSLMVITIFALIIAFFPFHNQCISGHSEPPQFSMSTKGSGNGQLVANSPLKLLSTTGEPFPWTDIRLPKFIVPKEYELSMRPDMNTFYNKGNVVILVTPTEKTNFLVIHIKKLNITEIFMTEVPNGHQISIEKQLECTQNEQLFIKFDSTLLPNVNYSLRISFERQLEEQLEGFYVSSYFDSRTGTKKYLLTTHFEPTAARSAFPCFDEPAMKATFSMNMVHETKYQAFFNSMKTKHLTIDKDNSIIMSVFEPTVPMSTYLVAFIVCDFNVHSTTTKDGINIRALVPADQDSQWTYALNSAASILTYFQEFFNFTYPLHKLDLVAVPDFGAGAMENWGLITFRTTMFLYNDNESSIETQEQVAIVVSHEIAHQWFGNLVTMDWWNDLWLNEGFASFVENLGVNYISPEWKLLDQFVVSTTQQALAMDSLQSSHPIMADVKNPSEIEAIFDAISYKKGASLIRMLENFLGIDKLRLGLSKYLHKYQYKTAKTRDLWQCLSEVSQLDSINVSAIMDTWVQQKGYPVVTVRRTGDRLFFSQKRFLSSPPNSDTSKTSDISPFGYKWIIPITLITDQNTSSAQLIWFNTTEMSIPFDESIKWFKLNANQSGFYRISYEREVWRSLTEVLFDHTYNRHVLSSTDRANLIDDAFSLMKIGSLDVNLAMSLTLYLRNGERDYVPWETAIYQFGLLDTVMLQNPLLRKFICGLIEPLITIWGWKDHSYDLMLVRKLRSLLLRAAVSYGDKQSIQMANRYFQSWMTNNTKIPANLREVVYTTGIQYGGHKEWTYVWNKYINATIPSEKKLLLGALGSTRNAWLLWKYLNSSLDKTQIKTQDTVHVITVVSHNPIGRDMVWKFIRENWHQIIKLFGEGSFSMDSIISETVWHFSSRFELKEVEDFFRSVSVGSGGQSVEQSLEKIRANIYWKDNIEKSVIQWLDRHNTE